MATRLQRQKGVHVLIDAAAMLSRRHPSASFLIAGDALFGLDPDYPRQLQLQVESLELNQRVRFLGFRDDVERLLASADVVVNSSLGPESLPTVILEAMASSKPVVATNLGGTPEIVQHGVTGFLVTPNSPADLAAAIDRLLRDSGLRTAMGEAGASRVKSHLNTQRMAAEIQAIYDDVLRSR